MSKMREPTISNCEKKFMLKCLQDHYRLDGRAFDEFRELKIEFGNDWGSSYVSLGKTQVLAQVSCEVQVPKSTRPSEGILYINLELNPIAAPNFEAGRQSELSVQLNRLLEKCIKDSKAVDLESLCIKVNEKVWALRLDINVLNYEGNILDCASVAALSALAHFRRPDVTCDGEQVVIHTYAQRDSLPTVIHHYPVCISFAIFSNGEIILADPSLLEEAVSEAHLMLGLNAYKELCGFHLGGSAAMSPDLILKTTDKATKRALVVIEQIKKAVEEDNFKRQNNEEVGFELSNSMISDKSVTAKEELSQYLERWIMKKKGGKKKQKSVPMQVELEKQAAVEEIGQQTAILLPPENSWNAISDEESEDDYPQEVNEGPSGITDVVMVNDSDGSEEESTIVLNADKQTNKAKRGKK